MGNTANCSSCGCGDKDDPKTSTVHVNMTDPRLAPPPQNSAQPAGKGNSRGTEDSPPTARKEPSPRDRQRQDSYADRNGGGRRMTDVTEADYLSQARDSQRMPMRLDGALKGASEDDGHVDLETRTERLADGSVFEGQFRGRDRHGWGKFTWSTGGSYDGQFDSNDMHGEGTYTWSDGSTYTGQWQQNSMGPRGIMQWTDGRRYEGQFKNGQKYGEGELKWPDGRSYSGQWEAGKQHGVGITVTGKGLPRKSQWEHGKLVRWLEDKGGMGEPDIGGTPILRGAAGDVLKGRA